MKIMNIKKIKNYVSLVISPQKLLRLVDQSKAQENRITTLCKTNSDLVQQNKYYQNFIDILRYDENRYKRWKKEMNNICDVILGIKILAGQASKGIELTFEPPPNQRRGVAFDPKQKGNFTRI